jgi:hypothetical protein
MHYLCSMKNKMRIWSEISEIIAGGFILLFFLINNRIIRKCQIIKDTLFKTHCYSIDNSLLFHCFPIVILLIIHCFLIVIFHCFPVKFLAFLSVFAPLRETVFKFKYSLFLPQSKLKNARIKF